ncbi:MAG: hypothetical protein H0X39_03820 [Actinobacteria bacterium]|nr:hypothetical protein [Actinomycetota bacterium]
MNIFKLVDESGLEGWQSGLFYQGYVAKLAATAFKAELAKTAGTCPSGAAAYFVPGVVSAPKAVAVPKKAGNSLKLTAAQKAAKAKALRARARAKAAAAARSAQARHQPRSVRP